MKTREDQPLVSVVTPVYNGESYLPECIESVIGQTYKNWEYLIVNNCSTDSTSEIAENYASKDSRIRVSNNKELLDMMQNWNHAMRQISPASKYCKVAHADDWLFPECIDRMVAVAEANSSVGIVGSYRLDENQVNLDGLPYPSTVVSGREICRAYLIDRLFVFGSPTSLLIRSDLIRSRDNFYEENNIHADLKVCFDILKDNDFGFDHQVLTFTRRHNETVTSLMTRFRTHILGRISVLTAFGPILLNDNEYRQALSSTMLNYHRTIVRGLLESKDKEFWNYHRAAIKAGGGRITLPKLIQAFVLEIINPRSTMRRIIKGS